MMNKKMNKEQVQSEPGPIGYQDPASEEVRPFYLMGKVAGGLTILAGGMNALKQQWNEIDSGNLKDFLAQVQLVCESTAQTAELLAGHLPKDDEKEIPKMIPKNDGMTKRGAGVLRKRNADLAVLAAKNRAAESILALPGRDF